MILTAALKQTWRSRHTWRNPATAFRFFWQVCGGVNGRSARFHLGNIPFSIRPADWFAFEEIVLEREYDFICTLFPAAPPQNVVDIGANVGLFSMYAFSLWPSATVHAIEPGAATFERLEANRLANPGLGWHTYRAAAWSSDGEVPFETADVSTSSRVAHTATEETVPAVSLDTILSRVAGGRVDLLKLDAEGAEEEILCGHEALLRRVDQIALELHPALCDADRVVASLASTYRFLHRLPARRSAKPILMASPDRLPYPLYESARGATE